jgi:hypothetical protein
VTSRTTKRRSARESSNVHSLDGVTIRDVDVNKSEIGVHDYDITVSWNHYSEDM